MIGSNGRVYYVNIDSGSTACARRPVAESVTVCRGLVVVIVSDIGITTHPLMKQFVSVTDFAVPFTDQRH